MRGRRGGACTSLICYRCRVHRRQIDLSDWSYSRLRKANSIKRQPGRLPLPQAEVNSRSATLLINHKLTPLLRLGVSSPENQHAGPAEVISHSTDLSRMSTVNSLPRLVFDYRIHSEQAEVTETTICHRIFSFVSMLQRVPDICLTCLPMSAHEGQPKTSSFRRRADL